MEQKFRVEGMTCSACSAAVEREVSKVEGVDSVAVNLLTNSMKVVADDGAENAILKAVDDAGYKAFPEKAEGKKKEEPAEDPFLVDLAEKKKRLIASVLLLLPLFYIAMGPMMGLPVPGFLTGTENLMSFALLQFMLATAILFLNRHYYINGF